MSTSTENSAGTGKGPPIEKWAMFLVGLTLLQSLRIALTSASLAMVRFKIPDNRVSEFINLVYNPMKLAVFTGMAIINIMALTPQLKGWFKRHSKWFAVFTNITLCLSFILILIAFTSGGLLGNLTFYYWTIVFGSFVYGMNEACTMTVGGTHGSFFNVGVPICSILVFFYHFSFKFIAELMNWSNVAYWTLFWQIVLASFISLVSAVVWIVAYTPEGTSDSQNGDNATQEPFADGVKKAWSPILMGVVGIGGLYVFYPAIAPYKLTDIKSGYHIDLAALFISAVPGISASILCIKNIGPDKRWEGDFRWWHFTWIFALPYFTAMSFCLVALHNPGSRAASSIKTRMAAEMITITLISCEEALAAVSYGAAANQVGKYCSCKCECEECGGCGPEEADCQCVCKETTCRCCQKDKDCRETCTCGDCSCKCCKPKDGGIIGAFNSFSTQIAMIIFSFVGDGYLHTYEKYEGNEDRWPTKHYGTLRSMLFWLNSGAYVAFKSAKNSFITDVRGKLLDKHETFFIVYADE